jgi:hypothetical protein
MAKGLGTLTVWLNTDTSKMAKGLSSGTAMIKTFSFAAKAAGAAVAGSITALGVQSVRAFMVQEEATNALSAALRNIGANAELAMPSLKKFAGEIQKQTVYGDEAIEKMMAYGLNLGINADQIKAATTAAAGLAAKYGIDLSSAMQLVGRASQGQTQMLARYGIILQDGLTKEEKFNELLRIGADNFGLATAQTDTLSGKLSQLSNIWGDLKEGIGAVLVEVFDLGGGTDWLVEKIRGVAEYIQSNTTSISFFIKSIYIEAKFAILQTTTLIGNIGGAVADVLGAAGKNIANIFMWLWDNSSKLFGNIFEIAQGYVMNYLKFFENFGKTLYDVMLASWDAILSVMKGGSVGDALDSVFEKAVEGLAKTVGDIGRETEAALNKAGVSKLEIEAPDYEGSWNKITGDIARLDAEREAALGSLFEKSMEKVGMKPGQTPAPGAKPGDQAKKAEMKAESSIVSAVQKGSAEALKIENTRVRKEDQIAKNTMLTAKNTGDIVKALKGLGKSGGGLGLELEDAF